MGRVNTEAERYRTLISMKEMNLSILPFKKITHSCISNALYKELRDYFALCAMARGKSQHAEAAKEILFNTRVKLEKNIHIRARKALKRNPKIIDELLTQKFFGASKKQGISIRLPLSSCEPTKLCSNLCYAHDVLDAAPSSVIRGAINGLIATLYEKNPDEFAPKLDCYWDKQIYRAIKNAHSENDGTDFKRESRIRFGHVGDGGAFPNFMNYLAKKVMLLSNGSVQPVIYTRHRLANQLDSNAFAINFTLDPASEDRVRFAPKNSRIVYSAFGGQTSSKAEINFLEHHRFEHFSQKGLGNVCPATHPDSLSRSCDGVKCDKCFIKIIR